MAYNTLIVTKEAGVATLTLNRPNKLNAWDEEMMEEGVQAIEEICSDLDMSGVEGLRADPEISAAEASIVTMRVVVVKPFQSLPSWFRQLYPNPDVSGWPQGSRYHKHS